MNFLRFRNTAPLRLHRIYSGRYLAHATTQIELHGQTSTQSVIVIVQHMPEWRGGYRWAYEIEWSRDDGTVTTLSQIGDSPQFSKREAVLAVNEALAAGYKFNSTLGWSLR